MTQNWADLKPRLVSALVMVVLGVGAILAGGRIFDILMLAIAFLGLRELWLMLRARLGNPFDIVILFSYGFALLAACLAFVITRLEGGAIAVFFLVSIVVASDVAGYFAGRLFGGPKFWPRISPKKTWSGTIAGWGAAALVGVGLYYASAPVGAPVAAMSLLDILVVALISAVLALAGQMGDIAQSAIKRRVGVKDSSNLIPGHGGILDRFDAMIGVGLVVAVLLLMGRP